MVFGVVVTKVGASRGLVKLKVALEGMIPDPVEAHVCCLRPFLLDGAVCKTNLSGVIDLHESRGLGMSEFFECCTDW